MMAKSESKNVSLCFNMLGGPRRTLTHARLPLPGVLACLVTDFSLCSSTWDQERLKALPTCKILNINVRDLRTEVDTRSFWNDERLNADGLDGHFLDNRAV